MTKINGINSYNINGYPSIYTKRTCLDNSEIYITSKLNMLYEQTMLNRNTFNCKRALKKMVEGNHIDETI